MLEILKKLELVDLKESSNKYKFNCIYCDDTKKNGTIYKESLKYHCFKCLTHKTIIEVLDEKNIVIDKNDYEDFTLTINKRNLFRINQKTIDYLKSKSVSRDDFKKIYNLIEVYEDKRSLRYIKNNLFDKKINKFLYNQSKSLIYFLNCDKDNIIGYCVLDLNNFGKVAKYYDLKSIYKKFKQKALIEQSINDLSNHFNILELDLSKPITIFDDVKNSIFYDNSIFAINKYNIYDYLDSRYFYANNEHGKERYLEKLSLSKKVFNWENFLNYNSIRNKIYDLKGLINYQKKSKKEYLIENFFN